MNHCLLCNQPIRKLLGQESAPDNLACWIHIDGGYVCKGSRSEFDLATFDPAEVLVESAVVTPPEDYCI